ncbi:hypothetical protein GCM10012286_06610 [Streptomyces lasiicapitis]|uniref:Uncharacterized protein n=1 Tax=Streptomyces lasiicapitis TaxID=1923961 RepID=A0ABQ2LIH6_9ACTN|nr:hypothetical protein GCM10012286_06610 [Streptomyces lasiicapitis]
MVSQVLGGQASEFGDVGWEVETEAEEIPILLEETCACGVAFRIESAAHIGSFVFKSSYLMLDDCSLGPRSMLIRPVQFKTRTGMYVLYLLPEII